MCIVHFVTPFFVLCDSAGCRTYFQSLKRSYREEMEDSDKFARGKLKKKYRARKQRVSFIPTFAF